MSAGLLPYSVEERQAELRRQARPSRRLRLRRRTRRVRLGWLLVESGLRLIASG